MPKDNNTQQRRPLSARRVAMLGSVAMIGATIALAGPLGHFQFVEQAFAAAPTSQTQGPAGFADLVAKVKPAVISVRVKLDEESNANASGPEAENLPPSLQGTPFEKFFRQFGDGMQGGKLQRHQVITGVGSGFFISADGYAVTNNHVVDHAKSVQVTTDDGTIYTAKVIGTDPKTDLALIKVDGKTDFSFANLENQVPRVGDWVDPRQA